MIRSIQNIAALLTQSANKSYNASLPTLIVVLKQLKSDMYLLQVGTQKIATRSHKPLVIGAHYWAQMGKSSLGHITLSNLIMQPQMLNYFANTTLGFELNTLNEIAKKAKKSKNDLMHDFNEFFAHKLAESASKEEFLFFSNILLGLKSGVLSLVISEKNDILQIKATNTNKIHFSAIMQHLGIIEGEIITHKQQHILDIKVMFESTKTALERNASELKNVQLRHIVISKHLKPMFELNQSLLDVRG